MNNSLPTLVPGWSHSLAIATLHFHTSHCSTSCLFFEHTQGWAGNYFLLGGPIRGKRILGQYPTDLSDKGPLHLGRGRLLPTTSWDSVWNAIALWAGIEEDDLDEVLPNRRSFANNLMSADDLFIDNAVQNETCSKDELKVLCDIDGRAGTTYGESGIRNLPVFLLLIVGIIVLGVVAISCWRRSEGEREERAVTTRNNTDVVL